MTEIDFDAIRERTSDAAGHPPQSFPTWSATYAEDVALLLAEIEAQDALLREALPFLRGAQKQLDERIATFLVPRRRRISARR